MVKKLWREEVCFLLWCRVFLFLFVFGFGYGGFLFFVSIFKLIEWFCLRLEGEYRSLVIRIRLV